MPEIWFPNLGIKIQHLSRTAFSIGDFNVYWYGLIIGFAIMAAVSVVIHEAEISGQKPEDYIDLAPFAIVLSVIGARLYYVIFSWDMYKDNIIKIFAFREGGLAIYGAVLTGILCGIIFAKKRKLDFFEMTDTVLMGVLLGQIIGRWGNFVNREAFGGYTDGLFAMRILKQQASYIPQSALDNIINISGVEYIQVQPTFLYESFLNLCLLIFILIIKRHKKFNGQIGMLYVIGYGFIRIFVESFRTDQLKIASTGIAVSQVVSAAFIILGIIIYIKLKNKKQRMDSIEN